MKKVLFLLLPMIILFNSCKKNKKDEFDHVKNFIGVYNAQRVGSTNPPFVVLIDKHHNDTVIIETKWAESVKTLKAMVRNETELTIPVQEYDQHYILSGAGELINNQTITLSYYITFNRSVSYKIIGSK
jgi:hypothetical protein